MEKKPILNIMVDLETASTKENAAILSWAMVAFSTNGEEIPDFIFERVVTLRSCFFAGMKIEVDTQEWWEKQTPQAKHHILTGEADSIRTVAKDAYMQLEALAESHDIYLWSRGIDFDLPKIKWCFEHLLEKDEKDFPFKFSHKMDVRTVLKFMEIDQSQFQFEGVQHRSKDDCMHDIRMIQEAYKWKEKWMMAYTAVEAGKTAKALKEKREDSHTQSAKLRIPEIYKLIPIPQCRLESDKGIGFSWEQVDIIEKEIKNLSIENVGLIEENEYLKQQLKNLQAMG